MTVDNKPTGLYCQFMLGYDEVASLLSARGIDIRKVFTHPVELFNGIAVYRARVQIGQLTKLERVPITHAQNCRDRLIGYLFDGPVLRTDAEIIRNAGSGRVELPKFVLMYKPVVPQNERIGLASGENRIRERPIIFTGSGVTHRAG